MQFIEKENLLVNLHDVEPCQAAAHHLMQYFDPRSAKLVCYELTAAGGAAHRWARFNAEIECIARLYPGAPICLVTRYLKSVRYGGAFGAGLSAATKRRLFYVHHPLGRDPLFLRTWNAVWVVDACYDLSTTRMLRDQFVASALPMAKVIFFVNTEDRTALLFHTPPDTAK